MSKTSRAELARREENDRLEATLATLTPAQRDAYVDDLLEGPRAGMPGRKIARQYPWLTERQQRRREEREVLTHRTEGARYHADGSYRMPRRKVRPRPPKV